MVERARQIADACIRDLHIFGENIEANNFLSNIFYFRVCSCTEQIAMINHLEKFVEENKNVVRLIIFLENFELFFDFVVFHFKCNVNFGSLNCFQECEDDLSR